MPVTIWQSELGDYQLHRELTTGAPTTRSHHSGVSLNPFQRRPLAAELLANKQHRATTARASITVSYNDEDDSQQQAYGPEATTQLVMSDHQNQELIADHEQHAIPPVGKGKSAEVIYTPPSTASEDDEETTTTTTTTALRDGSYPYSTFGQSLQEKFYPKPETEDEDDSESESGKMMSSDTRSEITLEGRPRRGYRRTSNDQTRRELRELMGQTLKEMEGKVRNLEMARTKQDQETSLTEARHQKEQDDLLFRLSTKHHEEILKLKEEHAKQMVNVKKEGATAELVQGLHRSYGQQIENLILEISDVKRLNELLQEKVTVADHEERAASVQETVRPASRHSTIPTVLEEHRSPPGYLQVSLQFVSFNTVYDVPSIRIPHPGASYTALTKSVRCAIGNYLAFLRSKDSIHSSSVDSALTYRLSLNLDSCTRLLFFGKGDLNGEEITEDKWLSRFNKTDDLIACVSPPPQHGRKPSSISISQLPETQTQTSYDEPPPTASTVRTTRSSAIWGRQPSSSVTSSLLRRSQSYSISSARPATSDIAEEESVSTASPPRGRSRVRSPPYVPASEADEPSIPYYDTAKELERINDQLSQMDGSRATVKTASLIDKDDNMTRVSGHASGIYTTRQGSSASVIAAYARVRQPLLRTNTDNEEGLEVEDLRNDVEDDDERGEGVELEAGSVLNAMSPHLVPDTRDLRNGEGPRMHTSEVDTRTHQYEMVGSGVDTMRVDESTEDEDEDEDETKEIIVGDNREFESLLEKEKETPLYLDEFLMRPHDKDKDRRGRSESPAFPSQINVKSHITGNKPVYQSLNNNTTMEPIEQQQKGQEAIHTFLKELKTGQSNSGDPIIQALAKSIDFNILRRALDETPAGREILSSATPVPRPLSSRITEEPKIISIPEDENVTNEKTGSSRSRSNNPWSHSRPAEISPRTAEHSHPLVDISGPSPPHPTPPPLVEPKVRLNAFTPLQGLAAKPLPNPHLQPPRFGIYGFHKVNELLPGGSPISSPSIISREEDEAKKMWKKQTLVTSAPLSRVSSPASSEASWGEVPRQSPRSLRLEDDDMTTTAPRGRTRSLLDEDGPFFPPRGSRNNGPPVEQYPSPYITSISARGNTFGVPPSHPFPTLEETYSLRDDGSVRSQYREPSLASSNPFSNRMHMSHHPPPPPPPSSSTRRSQISVYPSHNQIQRVTDALIEAGLNPQEFSQTFYAEFASASAEMQKEAIDNILFHQNQRKRVEQQQAQQQQQQAQQQQSQSQSQSGGSQVGNGGWGYTNGVPPPPLPIGFYTGQSSGRHGHGYGSMSSRGSGQAPGSAGGYGNGYPWQ
ncbi:hypothetical protein H072_1585 [Dactylellina haptotyla CBS 200.50]|uniref:Uncharacterized protein n=1 Tax=Dactylellina haptotyla (strain CBS 200.50) TaxID=1284197 RepID=S8ATX1_DACHA|nr:hypothetical protein H072_1585 [Dactylellina haptotyla CBS 200.50]